jgi:hypothetical protein
MKTCGLYFLFILFSIVEVRADVEAVIIEVRKNTSLSKNEKVFKNYFVSGGETLGLRKGTHVDVTRRLPVHDPLKNAAIGDLRIKVGTIEIIHSEERISVARLVSYESIEDRPLLDYEAVMIGDRLDLASIRLAPKPVDTVKVQEIDISGEKVALLGTQSRAEKLIQEGERHLASIEMKTKAEQTSSKTVARAPTSRKKSSKTKVSKVRKALKKK